MFPVLGRVSCSCWRRSRHCSSSDQPSCVVLTFGRHVFPARSFRGSCKVGQKRGYVSALHGLGRFIQDSVRCLIFYRATRSTPARHSWTSQSDQQYALLDTAPRAPLSDITADSAERFIRPYRSNSNLHSRMDKVNPSSQERCLSRNHGWYDE